jgi:hypothetical protein
VVLPEGTEHCCCGTLTAPAAELPLAQRIPFGTTAWRVSMNRRQVVESVNAAIKGAVFDVSRGFFRVFGRVKMTVLLGFSLAAYNLDRIRSFRAKQAVDEQLPLRRAKRRLGTWSDVITRPEEPPNHQATGPPG